MKKIIALYRKYEVVILYLFWGFWTTVINVGTFELLVNQFHVYFQTSTVIAWIVSVTFAFFTNKVWVFGSHYSTVKMFWRELFSFYWYRLLSLLMELVIVYIGIHILKGDPLIVKLIDNVIIVIINYVFSKLFVFNKTKNNN